MNEINSKIHKILGHCVHELDNSREIFSGNIRFLLCKKCVEFVYEESWEVPDYAGNLKLAWGLMEDIVSVWGVSKVDKMFFEDELFYLSQERLATVICKWRCDIDAEDEC